MSESKSPQLNRSFKNHQHWRLIKDNIAGKSVIFGGLGVILAIVLIFFYLLYVVYPLFQPASANPISQFQAPTQELGKTLLLAMEKQNEIAVRLTDQGKIIFFAVKTGKIIKQETVPIPENVTLVSFAEGNPNHGVVIYGLSDGRAIIAKHLYKISYPKNVRHITPTIEYPLGQQPIVVDRQGNALMQVAVRLDEDMTTIVAKTAGNRIVMTHLAKAESLFDDDDSLEQSYTELNSITINIDYLLIDKEQRLLYLADKLGNLSIYNITDKENPKLINHLNVLEKDAKISSIKFLNGEISLLIGDSLGQVSQWTLVRDKNNQQKLTKLRSFKVSSNAITAISAEQRRKGFLVADAKGKVGIYYSTSERELINKKVSDSPVVAMALSPRANAFLLQDTKNHIYFWHIHNEHPEISFKSLWQKVWYESYSEPAYIWQSSSSSNDFEPKLSLTPLLFGTLKAALYAMIVGIPLAIMGAYLYRLFHDPNHA